MKLLLPILSLVVGVIGVSVSNEDQLRHITYDVSVIRSNIPSADMEDVKAALLQAWAYSDLGSRLTNFARLVEQRLSAYRQQWSAVANEEAFYHNGRYFAKFKVRDLLLTKIVTLFSHSLPN